MEYDPRLNFIYVHLNRVIKNHDLDMIYVIGPGHGGPALVAQAYLEGTYSEVYPNISQDHEGMKRLFKQFSFPGGIPSHVAPETPGSIHEGGELGYALSHAYGAAFDNPDLIVACVVGDGEAETGPLATGWHSNKFLNPARDGAVVPILHLNGYKIANPCFLARIPKAELEKLFEGYGYKPYFVEGHEPQKMRRQMAGVLDDVIGDIKRIQNEARLKGFQERPAWPMIILISGPSAQISRPLGSGKLIRQPPSPDAYRTSWSSRRLISYMIEQSGTDQLEEAYAAKEWPLRFCISSGSVRCLEHVGRGEFCHGFKA